MEFVTYIENGKVDNKYIREHLQNAPAWRYIVDIRKWSRRTLKQNAYYWWLMEIIGGDIGYTKDEMSDVFKSMFLSHQAQDQLLWEITVVRSTSRLTTVEMMQYIDSILLRCAENGIVVPPPPEDIYPVTKRKDAWKIDSEEITGLT